MSSPCPHDPATMKGAPIGMYHCPECGEMVLAGAPHPDWDNIDWSEVTAPNPESAEEIIDE